MAKAGARDVRAGRAFVEFLGDDEKFQQALRRTQAKLRAWGTQIGAIGTQMMAAGAAIVAPLAAATKAFASAGDAVGKMAARTGMSTEAVSELGFAAEQSGANVETLEKGMRRMQKSLSEARTGSATAAQGFEQLGLSIEDLAGLKPEEQFSAIADRIARIKDPADRARAAMDVFGKAGAELVPMFAEGAAGIEKLRDKASELGRTMSAEDAKAAEDLTDAMNEMWTAMKAVGHSVGSALAPIMKELAEDLAAAAVAVGKWVRENRDMIVTAAKVGAALLAVGAVVKAVGLAMTLLAVNPVVLGLMAVAGAAAAVSVAVGDANAQWEKFYRTSRDYADRAMQGRAADMAAMKRLEELAAKGELNNDEMKEADRLIGQLEGKYGDLGVALDKTAGKISIAADAMENLAATMERMARVQQIAAMREEIGEMERVLEKATSDWHTFIRETFNSTEHNEKAARAIDNLTISLQRAREQLRGLESGAIAPKVLPPEGEQGEQGEQIDLPTDDPLAGSRASFEERMADQLHRLRIQQIEDEQERELAAIKHKYDQQRAEAKRLDADLTAINQAHVEEATAIAAKHREARAEEDRRAAEDRARHEEDLADRIARAKIEATLEGEERRQALLDLDEARELRRARELGIDDSRVRELFDWQRQAGRQGEAVSKRITQAGTFSAFGVRGLAAGGPDERTAKNTENLVRETKGMRRDLRTARPAFG